MCLSPQPHPPMHVSLGFYPHPSNQDMQSGRRGGDHHKWWPYQVLLPSNHDNRETRKELQWLFRLLTLAYQMHAHADTHARTSVRSHSRQVHVQRHTCKVVTPARPYSGAKVNIIIL